MGNKLGPPAKYRNEDDDRKKLIEKQITDSRKVLEYSKLKNNEEKFKEQFKGELKGEDVDEEEEVEEEEVEEEEEESEEEDEEEEEEWEEDEGLQVEGVGDYEAQEEGDLSFKEGEILTIINKREDGWWEVENKDGKRGTVPKTFLKMHNKYKHVQKNDDSMEREKKPTETKGKKMVEEEENEDEEEENEDEEEDDDEEDDEENEEEEDEEEDKEDLQVEGVGDYEAQEEEDLSFKEGEILTIINKREDGWWEAENKDGKRGTVPKTFLKMHNKYKHVQKNDDSTEKKKEQTETKGKKMVEEEENEDEEEDDDEEEDEEIE